MSKIPQIVNDAWNDKEGPIVLTTVDANGVPNAIYATCVRKIDEETIAIADNYFEKTKKNIQSGSKGSILFITSKGKSFQLKGSIEYHKDGPLFNDMKQWNPAAHPGHAAAALTVEEGYAGSEKLL